MKTALTILLIFVMLLSHAMAQQVKWITFEELPIKMRAEPKPILVFIYTDWCKYCAMQENTTFNNQEVINTLNDDCYALRLNAEEKKEITFLGKTYHFKPSGANTGHHELAELLARKDGKISFPTTILLSEQFQIVDVTSGFMETEMLLGKIETLSPKVRD